MIASFISLPMADLCMPPLGIASIKGYLKHYGVDTVKCYDLNLDFFEYCTMPQNLLRQIDYISSIIKNKDYINMIESSKAKELYECYLNGEYICNNIVKAKESMRKVDTYKSWEQYSRYSSIIERALKLFSIQYYPTIVSTGTILYKEGEDSEENIKKYINNYFENPLLSYFEKRLNIFVQKDTKYIGISVNYTGQIIPAITLAKVIRTYYPDIKIIFGGSLFPAYARRIEDLKIFAEFSEGVIPYAGEAPWYEILSKNTIEKIPGCIVSKNGKYISNNLKPPKVKRCQPDFSDFKLDEYLVPEPILPYTLSVGCYWGKCEFCGYQSYRDDTIEKNSLDSLDNIVIDDLKKMNLLYKVKNFYFVDEALPKIIGEKISSKIYSEELGFSWYSEIRFDMFVNREYLHTLKNGGCKMLFWGMESACDRLLSVMKKGTTRKKIVEALTECKNNGIKVMPMLFFGFPTETVEEAYNTVLFLQEYSDKIQYIGVGNFVLFRNIPVYKKAKEYTITIKKRKGELCLYDNYQIEQGMSQNEINDVLHSIYNDSILKKYFDFNLLSRNQLLFLPQEKDTLESKIDIKDIRDEVSYQLNKDCKITKCYFDLFEGKVSERQCIYIINLFRNQFYEIPSSYSNFLERIKMYKKYNINRNDKAYKLHLYLIKEGIVIRSE